jgi:hypothetical protein
LGIAGLSFIGDAPDYRRIDRALDWLDNNWFDSE